MARPKTEKGRLVDAFNTFINGDFSTNFEYSYPVPGGRVQFRTQFIQTRGGEGEAVKPKLEAVA